MRLFEIVFNAVIHGEKVSIDREVLDKVIDIASKNKVLLQFLRSTNIINDLRLREEARYRKFLENLNRIAKQLKDLDYLFIKLYKPITYVPADIDILVHRDQINEVVKRLRFLGYRVTVSEPYCITLTKSNSIVDVYLYPTIAGIVYLDTSRVIDERVYVDFNGIEIPIPKTSIEVILVVSHAIYKEKLYTLNDFAVVDKWFKNECIDICKSLYCVDALRIALQINKLVKMRITELPLKIPTAKWFRLLAKKFIEDSVFRSTSINVLKSLKDPRFGKLLISKFTRETY